MQTIIIPCSKCGTCANRTVDPIHPDRFTNPDKAEMLSLYWCSECGAAQIAKYSFYIGPGGGVKVDMAGQIDPSKFFIKDKVDRGLTVRPRQKSLQWGGDE